MKSKELMLAEIRLSRTVDAAYHALLEMSAWMGIPQSKRMAHIKEHMSNVIFCAENNVPEDLNIVSKGGIMEQKPSIGRVVHYQKYGTPGGEHKSEPSAAIITKVINEETKECQLFVMNPNGVYFNATPYSEEPKPGHWNWPPRV